MTGAEVLDVGRDAIYVLLVISAPPMAVAMILGLAIALFQALTQIQEMTLTFVPKIVAMFFSLILLFPFMGATLNGLMQRIADRIVAM